MIWQKNPKKTTLSIGDGANDVNMILAAHVGVGIQGLEGAQAAKSADYVISRFKDLKPLLFIHGWEAYWRNAYLVHYMFYKSFLFMMPYFWAGFFSNFSASNFYEPYIQQLYSAPFTFVPIIWYAVFDF